MLHAGWSKTFARRLQQPSSSGPASGSRRPPSFIHRSASGHRSSEMLLSATFRVWLRSNVALYDVPLTPDSLILQGLVGGNVEYEVSICGWTPTSCSMTYRFLHWRSLRVKTISASAEVMSCRLIPNSALIFRRRRLPVRSVVRAGDRRQRHRLRPRRP